MPEAYLTPKDVERLENAATKPRDRLLIHLLFDTGCRISEALALTPKDIDLNRGTITIQHLKSSVRLLCPNCNARLARRYKFCPICATEIVGVVEQELERHRMRGIPISDSTVELMREGFKQARPDIGDKPIFGITRSHAYQIIKGLAEKVGIKGIVNPETGQIHHISPHKLRDAFAVDIVQKDSSTDSMIMLQQQMGHVSFNTTAKYRKVSGQELRDWHQRMKGK